MTWQSHDYIKLFFFEDYFLLNKHTPEQFCLTQDVLDHKIIAKLWNPFISFFYEIMRLETETPVVT